jgi:hypothetical protein
MEVLDDTELNNKEETMKKWVAFFRVVVLASISMIFAGCGSGGSVSTTGNNGTASAAIVQGVAATGGAMAFGTVYLRDSSIPCQERTASINESGNFEFDVTGLKKPFFLKAVGTSEGRDYTLYAIAVYCGTTNINPISHMATVAAAKDMDLNTLFNNFRPVDLQNIAAFFQNAVSDVMQKLLPLTICNGVPNVNPVTDTFVANHQGLDGLFDLLNFDITPNEIKITNKHNNAPIYLSQNGDILYGEINLSNIPTTTIGNPVCASIISIDSGKPIAESLDIAKIYGSGS